MKQFINKKANDLEEAIINAIANEIESNVLSETFNVDIDVNDTTIILDGSIVYDSESRIKWVMIDNFNAYDLDGEDKVVDVDTIKIEKEVEYMVA